MFHLRRTPARPGHTVIITIGRAAFGLQAGVVKGVPVLLVLFQPFRTLAGVTDGPHAFIEFTGYVFDQRFLTVDLDIFEQLLIKPEFLRELVHDGVVGQGLEQRLDDLVTPLQRTVGRSDRTISFELGGRGQQVHAIGTVLHDSADRGIGVDDHHQVQFFHGLLHLYTARLAVGRVPPEHHGAHIILLCDLVLVFQHTVDPARYRYTLGVHRPGRFTLGFLVAARVEAPLHPVVIHAPDTRPVFPGTGGKTVVARQRVTQYAKVGRALDIVVTAEDIGAATGYPHVAQHQLEYAVGTGVVVADGVLGAAHAPDKGAGFMRGHDFGGALDLFFRHP